jgi:hypothetical protein
MSDILSRLEMAVAENNGAAIINLVEFELMDAVGKTIREFPADDGTPVYYLYDEWGEGDSKISKTIYEHGVTEYEQGVLGEDWWFSRVEAKQAATDALERIRS